MGEPAAIDPRERATQARGAGPAEQMIGKTQAGSQEREPPTDTDVVVIREALPGGWARMANEVLAPEGPIELGSRQQAVLLRPGPLAGLADTRLNVQVIDGSGRIRPSRRKRTAPQDLSSVLRDWDRRYGTAPLHAPITSQHQWQERYRQLRALGNVSLDAAAVVLQRTSVDQLVRRGFPIPTAYQTMPLPSIVSAVIYVGPGFGAIFSYDGRFRLMSEPLGGGGFPVIAVTAPGGDEAGGLFLGARDHFLPMAVKRGTVELGEVRSGRYRFRSGGGTAVDAWDRELILFVVSDSYWDRADVATVVRQAPGRLWDAVSRCVLSGYLSDVAGDVIAGMDAWKIVKQVFQALLAVLSPVPLPWDLAEDLKDVEQLMVAIEMAILGRTNTRSDIDAAARLLAPLVLGLVIRMGSKGGVLAGRAVIKAGIRGGRAVMSRSGVVAGRTPAAKASATSQGPETAGGALASAKIAGSRATSGKTTGENASGRAAVGRATEGKSTKSKTGEGQPSKDKATGDKATSSPPIRPEARAARLRAFIGESRYAELIERVRRYLDPYLIGKDPKQIVQTVKGYVHEAPLPQLPEVQKELARARQLAPQLGVDPATVRFTTDAWDMVMDKTGRRHKGALGDGLIYGVRQPGVERPELRMDEDLVKGIDEIMVFDVIEVKSAKTIRELVWDEAELGQIERSRARLEQLSPLPITTIDGAPYPGSHILTSVDGGITMHHITVVPKGTSKQKIANLRRDMAKQGRRALVAESFFTDPEAFAIAEHILQELAAKK